MSHLKGRQHGVQKPQHTVSKKVFSSAMQQGTKISYVDQLFFDNIEENERMVFDQWRVLFLAIDDH